MLATTHAQSLALKAKLFRGFADPSRLSLLEALRDDARSVGELVEITGLAQPNVSNHLACLLDCGLVAREPRGRRVIYRLADERVGTLLGLADELLEEVARGVYVCPRYEAPSASAPVPLVHLRPAAR
jgi:DNA-binding transcriptional ArsR family regulator